MNDKEKIKEIWNHGTPKQRKEIWKEITKKFKENASPVPPCCQKIEQVYDYAWRISGKKQWAISYECPQCQNLWMVNLQAKNEN